MKNKILDELLKHIEALDLSYRWRYVGPTGAEVIRDVQRVIKELKASDLVSSDQVRPNAKPKRELGGNHD